MCHGSANDAPFPDHERHKSDDVAKWMPDPGRLWGLFGYQVRAPSSCRSSSL
jgi:hypothetical protein